MLMVMSAFGSFVLFSPFFFGPPLLIVGFENHFEYFFVGNENGVRMEGFTEYVQDQHR